MAQGMGLEAPSRTTRRHALGATLLAVGGVLGGFARRAVAEPHQAGSHHAEPWPDDKPTPPVALVDLAGRPWTLDAMRGQVVALNFWATWCAPCRTEMPSLQRLQAARRARGLAVVTVNYREGAAAVRDFVRAPFDLPVLLDADGDVAGAWTPRVFPTTVLVDRAGRPRTVVVGSLDWTGADADRLLEPLLAAARS